MRKKDTSSISLTVGIMERSIDHALLPYDLISFSALQIIFVHIHYNVPLRGTLFSTPQGVKNKKNNLRKALIPPRGGLVIDFFPTDL
jgi:hypothetical protein